MDLSISGLIAQILNFGLLFRLFRKYLTTPITQALEERKELIEKLSRAEDEYNKKIQEADIKSKEIIDDARKAKEGIIADAGILAEKRKTEIIQNANDHADKIIKDANEKMATMEKSLENSYEDAIKKTSIMVLKKLIKKSPEIQNIYIKESIENLKK